MDSRRGLIEDFLAGHPGRFCTACVAAALDIPARDVSMARHRLTATGLLRSEHARCSACNKLRLVVAAGTPASPATQDGAVRARLGER